MGAGVMTVATIVLAFAAFAAGMEGALPPDVAQYVSAAAILAGAVGRALVMAAQELSAPRRMEQEAALAVAESNALAAGVQRPHADARLLADMAAAQDWDADGIDPED